jgi:hypothetical protein
MGRVETAITTKAAGMSVKKNTEVTEGISIGAKTSHAPTTMDGSKAALDGFGESKNPSRTRRPPQSMSLAPLADLQ